MKIMTRHFLLNVQKKGLFISTLLFDTTRRSIAAQFLIYYMIINNINSLMPNDCCL
jgi:hypothetical protein